MSGADDLIASDLHGWTRQR